MLYRSSSVQPAAEYLLTEINAVKSSEISQDRRKLEAYLCSHAYSGIYSIIVHIHMIPSVLLDSVNYKCQVTILAQ